jgi:hypothetical protein
LQFASSRPDVGNDLSQARGPLLWEEGGDAQMDERVQAEPHWSADWDLAAQPAPDYEVDQRINW